MSANGLNVFDKTLQTTHVWLDDLMLHEVIGPDWKAPGAVLRTMRDHVPLALAAHLGAQLPLLVRRAYYDQRHMPQSDEHRTLGGFLEPVRAQLAGTHPAYAREPVTVVFGVLSRRMDRGQCEKACNALSGEEQALWPDDASSDDGDELYVAGAGQEAADAASVPAG